MSCRISVLIFLVLFPAALFSNDQTPLPVRQLLISDGEYLKYDNFKGGEKWQDISLVTRLSADGKTLNGYIGKYTIGSHYPMPSHYSNYQRQFTVSLETGSLVQGFGNYIEQNKADNKTGENYFSIEIDRKKNMAIYISKIWDGYDTMQKVSRVPVKPGFPAWDLPSVAFVGTRFLDIQAKGIIYGVVPSYVKDAVPVSGRLIKKEMVETPAGKFLCRKYGVGISDAMLANLLESYVKELYIWVEDAPRGLVIKTQTPDEMYVLKEIGEWK